MVISVAQRATAAHALTKCGTFGPASFYQHRDIINDIVDGDRR